MDSMGRRLRPAHLAGALGGFALAAVALAPSLAGRSAFLPADVWLQAVPWRLAFPAAARTPPANPQLSDQALLYAPQLWVVRESLAAGSVPLWNPAFGCGEPLLPTALSGPFAPTRLPVLALPWPLGFAWSALLTFGLMWAGAFRLGRALGLGAGLCATLAVGLAFAPGFLAHFQQPRATTLLWLPWLLAAIERVAAAVPLGGRGVVRAALPIPLLQAAALLGGHPGDGAHVGLATGLYAALRLPWRPCLPALGVRLAAAAALLLGAALAAPLLGPFAQALAGSATLAERSAAAPWVLPAEVYALYWNPFALGSPLPGASAGPWRGVFPFEEEQQHIGVLPWVLLAAGIARARAIARADAIRLAAFAALALVCGTLAYGWPPLHGWLVALPPFSLGANPRLSFFAHAAVFAAAAVAARPWLASPPRAPRGRAFAALLVLAAAGAALSLALASAGAWRARPVVALGSALAVLAAGRLAASEAQRRCASALLPLLLLAELAPVYRGLYPQVPRAWAEPSRARAALPAPLRDAAPLRAAFENFTPPNLAALLGATDALAYSYPVSARYDAFARRVLGLPDPAALTPEDLRRPEVVAGLARTCASWLATSVDLAAADRLELAHVQGRLRVYRLRDAPPWAAWHADAEVARVRDLEQAVAHVRATLARTPEPVAVEDASAPAPAASPPAAGVAAEARRTTPQRIEIGLPPEAGTRAGWLVLRESHDAGWRASDEAGHPLRVVPAQVRSLAVEVPAGTRRVMLRYRPPRARAGVAIAASALLALGAVAFAARPRAH